MKNIYKVCVYAICKNEEKHIDRWYQSVKEADEIYVLDTGSTDNSVKKLKDLGVNVTKEEILPWRFDIARNKSLDLLPKDTDICVCIDLDEVFEPNWRKELEKVWCDNTTRIKYIYNWSIVKGKPTVSFYYDKIHAREGYKWTHPVHEILKYEGRENIITTDNIILNHYPDPNKSRSSYLNLLELSVKEEPNDDRNMHYLGREYMYHKEWNKAIDTLIKHLSLKTATWNQERAASMRFIARSYQNLSRYKEARMYYKMAIEEAKELRDGYVELALLEYNQKNYLETINLLTKALSIKKREKTYINETFSWDYTIDNLLSASFYYLELYDIALFYIKRALLYEQDNPILLENYKIIKDKN